MSYPSPVPHVPLMCRSCAAPIPHTQIRNSDPAFRKSSWCGIFHLDAYGYGAVGCAHHRMARWEQRTTKMKSTPHTPGPWRQTGPNVRAGDALICWATNHHANAETPESEKLANARLIAAAPQMLLALERLTHPMADDEDLDYAREIISKATGGSK